MNQKLKLLRTSHTIDLILRKDGHEYRIQGDWVKPLIETWSEMHSIMESLNNLFGVLENRPTAEDKIAFLAHTQTLRHRIERVLKASQNSFNITEIWR